ncbi:hypothetical protein M569_07821 [Genlisea aurea]|uniref:F-box domain-containing protein n=1 Tax=Genlisea aurea TaxID=192259 RepID=S8CQ41_9LAMI|nr:hypothetical protein M569_07821 [Genlisea aurea]
MEAGSKSKRMKQEEVGEDRISALPNDILHQILSCLPIKSIAQTSLLSKRWRSLWHTFPDLDFTTVESLTRYADRRGPRFASKTVDDVAGIKRLLLARKEEEDSGLRLFRLRTVLSFARLRRLIECAVALDVQELDIDVNTSNYFDFPDAVLGDKRLMSLRLKSGYREIKMPSAEVIQQAFQSLTVLSLTRGDFRDEPSAAANIFTDPFFPSLKRLALEFCFGIKHLRVQLKNLLDLTVLYLRSLVKMELNSRKLEKLIVKSSFANTTERPQVLLSSPSLRRIVWSHNTVVENWNFFDSLTSLEEVFLCDGFTSDKLKLKSFIAGISHCRSLSVDKTFIYAIPTYKPFNRLTSLSMEICYGPTTASAEALAYFLRSSPSIETLVLRSCGTWSSEDSWNWDLASVGPCLNHLRILTVYGFAGAAHDSDFVRFVLKNAAVLETVHLHSKRRDEKVRNEVRGYPRASPKCAVRLYSPENPTAVFLRDVAKGLLKINDTLEKIMEKAKSLE